MELVPQEGMHKDETGDEFPRRTFSGRDRSFRSRTAKSSNASAAEAAQNVDFDDDSFDLFKENTTFHGVRDFFVSQSCAMHCLWAFLISMALIFAVHGSYMILSEYLERPVIVSYFIQEAGRRLALPDIVICPFNRYNRSYLEELNVSHGLAQYLELSYPSPMLHSFQMLEYAKTMANIDRLDFELERLLRKLGNISFAQFIKRSTIDCTAFFEQKSICENLTETMSSAGKCFRIPGGDQEGDGFGYGVRIVIKLPSDLYNPGVNQMLNDGIAVKLAERNRGIDHDLTFIPTGVHAIIPLTATKYEFMNDPPRYMCEEDADLTYSRVWCFEVCLTQRAEDVCNCSLAAATVLRKTSICTAKQFFHCFAKELFSPNDSHLVEHCKAQCKPPCSYWHFHKSVSYAHFPAKHARFFVNDEAAWEDLQNTITLEVFYTSLDFTVIKHMVAMTPSSFIAQIGGQISLWIGGSIISILQLLIYLSRWINAKVRRKFCRKSKKVAGKRKQNGTLRAESKRIATEHA